MKFEIDKDLLIKDFSEMLDIIIVHGFINSRYKKQRRPVVNQISKECSRKIAEGLYRYLTAFEIKESKCGGEINKLGAVVIAL